MQLLCPEDRHQLREAQAGWHCPHCGWEYSLCNDVPDFTRRDRADDSAPLVDELLEISKSESVDDAVRTVQKQRGFAQTRNCAEWKYMFPVAAGENILELGAGVGDDTLLLATECPEVAAVVPSVRNGELLLRRFQQHGISNVQVVAADDLTRQPWDASSFGGIAFEDVAAGAFALSRDNIGAFAEECSRLLKPGGTVCLGLRSMLQAAEPLQSLKSRVQVSSHPESLNRAVKHDGRPRPKPLAFRHVARAMRSAGFAAPQLFAPLPDESQTKVVLPLTPHEPLNYYFDRLMRSDTVVIRILTRLMKLLVRIGMIRFALPYTIVLFQLPRETSPQP